MIHLLTDRLILRNLMPGDLDDMLELTRLYEASEMGEYDQPFPQNADELRPLLDYLSSTDEFAAVELQSPGKVIGLIQFQRKKEYVGELVRGFGFNFNSKYHGKGYATEACIKALDYLLGDLQVEKCTAGTASVNIRSRKLLERVGFQKVGEKLAHFREDAHGVPIEFLYTLYELPRDQWKILLDESLI